MPSRTPRAALVVSGALFLALFCTLFVACKPKEYVGLRALHVPVQADIGALDPMLCDSIYDTWASAAVNETLLEYHYLKRPLTLKPLLLKEMPRISKDGLRYTFTLKRGIYFHDCPCFPGGKGRELIARDVLYSIKRMANRAHRPSPRGWWIYEGRIVGLDDFRKQQYQRVRKQGLRFDVDAPVKGLKLLGRYRFQLLLTRPFPQLLYLLAYQKTAIVPREAVEYYAQKDRGGFRQHPIGTGPFIFVKWRKGVQISFRRNPRYRHSRYPTDGFSQADRQEGLDKDAGKPLPRSDILVVHTFQKYQPAWLKFRVGDLSYVTVGSEYWDLVYTKTGQLREAFVRERIGAKTVSLLDFIYIGFNFKDPIVGGYSQRSLYLRRALRAAYDLDEINRRFYNNRALLYSGVIPPGLSGHIATVPKADLARARRYLAKAGYPGGKGLPVLRISTAMSSQAKAREDVFKRQMARIGVRIRYDFSTFSQLSRKLRSGKTQMFSLAWGSDYPDAENNLMLFYGPNRAPGPNSWNYDHPVYNKLYEKARGMLPSPARAALYKKMNQHLIDQVVSLGSIARTRYYLNNPTVTNFRPDETIASFWKYLRAAVVR